MIVADTCRQCGFSRLPKRELTNKMSVIKLKSNLNLQTSECRNMVANNRNINQQTINSSNTVEPNLNQQTSNGQRNQTTNNSESDTGKL